MGHECGILGALARGCPECAVLMFIICIQSTRDRGAGRGGETHFNKAARAPATVFLRLGGCFWGGCLFCCASSIRLRARVHMTCSLRQLTAAGGGCKPPRLAGLGTVLLHELLVGLALQVARPTFAVLVQVLGTPWTRASPRRLLARPLLHGRAHSQSNPASDDKGLYAPEIPGRKQGRAA